MSILRCVKYLEREEQQAIKLKNDIIFLKRCCRQRLTPTGMKIRNHWNHIPRSSFLFDNMEHCLMKQHIHHNFAKLKRLEESIATRKRRLLQLPKHVHLHIRKYIEDVNFTFNAFTKNKQIVKFNNLLAKQTLSNQVNQRKNAKPHQIPRHWNQEISQQFNFVN